MKTIWFLLFLSLASNLLLPPVCRAADQGAGPFPPQLLKFSAAKEQQVHRIAADLKITVPPEIGRFFTAATYGDYATVSNILAQLRPELAAALKKPGGHLPAWNAFWQPMTEVEIAYKLFATGGQKYPLAFGETIIRSIPPGSIYFGGSDAGRMLVTALCKSQAEGKPFYTLTQDALFADKYMDYVRAMYGKQIYLPTTNDEETALKEYKADAWRRYEQGKRITYEDVRVVGGKVQVHNPTAMMGVSARLVKIMLKHNPRRELYMEESFPLVFLYPYLSPHGLIFRLHHEPLLALTPQMLDADHACWKKESQSLVGGWLKQDTSLSNVCDFALAVYGRKDWSDFSGDKEFVTNRFATHAFSKLRVAIAGLYAWRLFNDSKPDEKARLRGEADYAFRQAFALCPTSQGVLYRYLHFLLVQRRIDDAILLMDTAHKLAPDNQAFYRMLVHLRITRVKMRERAHRPQ